MWKILGVIICSYIFAIAAKSCTITLPDDIKGFAPVILTKTDSAYDIFRPTAKVTQFAEGSILHFICTGSQNFIKSLQVSSLDLKCSDGQFVDSNNNPIALKTLVCKSIPRATLKVTTTKCSKNRGVIYETGMEVYTKFYPVLEICYDNRTETTFYTHNTLHGATVESNIHEKSRPSFSAAGMKSNTKTVNFYYTLKNQLKRFAEYFGNDQTYIDSKRNFLSRGHLSPDGDFMFGYDQYSTYFFANVAPQYQSVNGGNWNVVENRARKLAAEYGEDIETYNGIMGTVEFPTIRKSMVRVYLDPEQELSIPKYYFKVLWHKSTDSAIVFLSVNNPFATGGAADEFCTNICAKANLDNPIYKDAKKGHTFCCTLEEFSQHYDGLPPEVSAKNLLMGK